MSSPGFRLALACSVLAACGSIAAAAGKTSRVVIRVSDPSGADVPHARIRLAPMPDPAPSVMETDGSGRLSLDLKPAGYALFVRTPGFKGVAMHIDVTASDTAQSIPVVLQVGSQNSPVVHSAAEVKDSVMVSAFPYHADVFLKAADLQAMTHTTVTVHNPHTEADETYAGVRVAEIFSKLGVTLGKGLDLNSYLIASGSDGYSVVLAMAEADPSFHPGDVMVADSMNGHPMDAKSGPFKLVVTEDKRPARSVRNLVSLVLKSTAY